MLTSQTVEDLNCSLDLGMAKFTMNSVRNEITWDMFKKVIEESKLGPVLRP